MTSRTPKQPHPTVEHMLDRVVDAGFPAERVLTKPKDGDDHPWTAVRDASESLGAEPGVYPAPVDVPRGIDFLLSVDRLNVAISRGQWAAYLVRSPGPRWYLRRHRGGWRG